MAIRQVRVGSMVDIHQYDDTDYDSAIETDQPMKAGIPIDSNDVIRKADVGTLAGDVVGPASSTDNAVARFNGAGGKNIQNSLVTIDDSGLLAAAGFSGSGASLTLIPNTINSNVTAVSSTTILGADDDLQTFSVAADTLLSTGDRITFRASGSIVSSTAQKRLKVKFGSATLFDTGATGFPVSASIEWVLTGEIIKDGATQQCNVAMFTNNASLASYADIINAGEDSTIANILKLTGATSGVGAAAGDVVQETFTVEYHPAA